MARLLLGRGQSVVRPLEGGFDAWLGAGLPTEPLDDAGAPLQAPAA